MSEQTEEPSTESSASLSCTSSSSTPTGASPAAATTTSTTATVENYEVTANGHLIHSDRLTNGVAAEHGNSGLVMGAGASGQNFIISHGHAHNHVEISSDGSGSNSLHQPAASSTSNQRASSPSRSSPITGHASSSRGNSPNNQDSTTSPPGQHVVHVHINPGETFSVRMGDQIQHIQGPATVRMVSNNGPPMPMPMQVPPGHMVQQIVDENGVLTHVILSPQPPGMHGPPMTGTPNSNAQQVYPPYGPQYPPYHAQYPPHHHPHHGAPPHAHMHPVPPHQVHSTPSPPHQCNNHSHGHPHTQGPPPSHHNHTHISDDRTQRTKQRLQEKLKRQRHNGDNYYNNTPPSPSRRAKSKVNGEVPRGRGHDTHSSSSSTDGHELEEERRVLHGLLSKMSLPKISNVEPRSALIELTPPQCNAQEFEIDSSEFKYELLLSDKGREGKGKVVYSGDATEITLQDLKPATEYFLRVSALLDDLHGNATELVSFKTLSCRPEPPQPPKLSQRTKTSLFLKWNASSDNGSKISSYILEYDKGRGDGDFVEVYSGLQRQYKVTKLNTATGYVFRLAACNGEGKSDFSDHVCFCTSGSAPSQPDPPMLSEPFVKALTISWIKRPNDDEFTLQMEDEVTGHGFLSVYNGPDLSHTIKNLRRNTEYRFRLTANNEEGKSKWSDVVCYRTLPDRPSAPPKPVIKGRAHATNFRVTWDSPKDIGGSEISKYLLELDDGRGFELVYEGPEKEFLCDHLMPGHLYRLRACCVSAGGCSDWSEMVAVTTQAMCPGQCQAPKLQGKPKATMLHLRWCYPDYNGGAQVTEYEVLMTSPDNSTREAYRGRDLDCTVAGLSPGRPYLFQVRAVNKAGAGPWSDSLEVVSGAGVPDPPKMPMVHCKSPHGAVITWEDPVNNGAIITDYRLEWQQKTETDFTQLYLGSALSYEVKGLTPASTYSFRVQALNSAGAGAFSSVCSCQTPPSSPGSVLSLRAVATADSIHVMWREPNTNGSDIKNYNIDIGEKHLITVGNVLEHTIPDLLPETTYRIRVQAVNEIGVGAFSSALKVVTRSLPPAPPRLECVSSGPNSLKLKWGDGKNPDLLQYVLEMLRDNGTFYPIYNGPSNTHKVNKLSELTEYQFRIYASNEAGDGPYSSVLSFKTTKAPPPAVKAPKISETGLDKCLVEWQACKQMGSDSIVYTLQLQHKDQEYRQVYKGTETSYLLSGLAAKTDYQVRVCAMRQCCDDTGDLIGAFSPGVPFSTLSLEPVKSAPSKTSESRIVEVKQLTDQQIAMVIMIGFAFIAVVVAFITQQFLL